ncbi:MAG: hypothetical protein RL172_1811 [Bacteroidota bacterium]|jgi:transmembrane sensor
MTHTFNSAAEMAADEAFLNWFYKKDEASIQQWQSWMDANPAQQPLITEAVSLLQALQLAEKPLPAGQLQAAEARLMAAIKTQPAQEAPLVKIGRFRLKYVAAAAAVLALVLVGLKFISSPAAVSYNTAFGEIATRQLPDGSTVTLNAHTQLAHSKNWQPGTSREVWLNGEAYFQVQKTPGSDKFIVHTDGFDIEVTGTAFTVKNLPQKNIIILKEGSVLLQQKGQDALQMKPGEKAEMVNGKIVKQPVGKTDYLAWTERKLVFDNTPIAEVASTIVEHYGVQVTINGDGTRQQTITGILPNNNLAVLLQALQATGDFSISQNNHSIVISGKQ